MNVSFDPDPLPAEHNKVRTSNKIKYLYVRVRGILQVSDASNRIRLSLLRGKTIQQDVNPFAADPTVIYNNKSGAGGSYIDMMFNRKLVTPLHDKVWNLQTQAEGSTRVPYVEVDFFTKIDREIEYRQATAANVDYPIKPENVFLVGVSDSSAVPHPRGTLRMDYCFKNIGN